MTLPLYADTVVKEHMLAIARGQERYLRAELKALRTHRLNVYLLATQPTYKLTKDGYVYEQRMRLCLLLPRGPRPLP